MMNETRPTKKQRELLSFIDGFVKGNGYGPSYREIMRALDYKSVSTVAVHIDGLIQRGLLEKKDRSARSLAVVTNVASNTVPSQQTGSQTNQDWLIATVKASVGACEESDDETLSADAEIAVESLRVFGIDTAYATERQRLDEYLNKQ